MHNADEIVRYSVAKRLVEHLERLGFGVVKKPPNSAGVCRPTEARQCRRRAPMNLLQPLGE